MTHNTSFPFYQLPKTEKFIGTENGMVVTMIKTKTRIYLIGTYFLRKTNTFKRCIAPCNS